MKSKSRSRPKFKTLIESLSVRKIALLFAGWIIIFTIAYWFIPKSADSNLKSGEREIENPWDACYFSIVTATTLGYGDVLPTGWFRLAASIEVLGGLLLGGLAVSVVATVPIRDAAGSIMAALGVQEAYDSHVLGLWLERSEQQKRDGDGEVVYGLSQISMRGSVLVLNGETISHPRDRYQTNYQCTLVGCRYSTFVFEYLSRRGDVGSSSGLLRIEFDHEPNSNQHQYRGEYWDRLLGVCEDVHGKKITDPESLVKLRDPGQRDRELRRLVLEVFKEDISH